VKRETWTAGGLVGSGGVLLTGLAGLTGFELWTESRLSVRLRVEALVGGVLGRWRVYVLCV